MNDPDTTQFLFISSDSGLAKAYKGLADDVHSFIRYIAINNKSLSPEEVVLVAAAIIHAFPELFEDNSAMHECLKEAAIWVKRR